MKTHSLRRKMKRVLLKNRRMRSIKIEHAEPMDVDNCDPVEPNRCEPMEVDVESDTQAGQNPPHRRIEISLSVAIVMN